MNISELEAVYSKNKEEADSCCDMVSAIATEYIDQAYKAVLNQTYKKKGNIQGAQCVLGATLAVYATDLLFELVSKENFNLACSIYENSINASLENFGLKIKVSKIDE